MFLRTLCILSAYGFLTLLVSNSARADDKPAKQIRVGIIGLDTSHVTAFTNAVNGPKAKPELQVMRIVAAFPGGSPDLPTSIDRVPGFTEAVKKQGVEIVDSINALLPKVDAVLLESVDGRPHLEQARPVIKAGKPMFIDKPAAASLADAMEIYRLAQEAGVPCFSSSSLRFSPGIASMKDDPKIGQVLGCVAYSPCSLDPHHPDLFWYGIHGVEELYTIMGPGCVSVSRVHTDDTDVATGVWRDGRVGTFRGLRGGKGGYGAVVFGAKGIGPSGSYGGYEPLLLEIAKFFQTGKPPVSAAETLELLAFMEAADESKRQNGAMVTIESVMEKAKAANAARTARNAAVTFGHRPMGQLFNTVRKLVAAEKYVIGLHASERLDERGIMEWRAVVGIQDGELIAERPNSSPNATIEVREFLPDGTSFVGIWAHLRKSGVAKLVTVFFDRT